MKQLTTALAMGLVLLATYGYGQSMALKNNLSIGGGNECYNGDLGNSWFKPEEERYGFVSIQYDRYLNKSWDVSAAITHGDYGHCREEDEPVYRADGTEVLNMLSRLTTGIVSVKYKIANGYLLKQDAKFAPFVFAGAGINNLSNFAWKNKDRVNTGNLASLNGGMGLHLNFAKRFNFTYKIGVGYFSGDNLDRRIEGANDMYLQHTFLIGKYF